MKKQEMVTIHKVVYNECIEVAIENEKLKKVNEDQEIVIRGINALLKTSNEIANVQNNLIESLKLTIKGQAAKIEKLKDSIRAYESEQKDYEKTCVRLRGELSELNEKADEDFKFIENHEQENSRLKSEIAFLEEKIK